MSSRGISFSRAEHSSKFSNTMNEVNKYAIEDIKYKRM